MNALATTRPPAVKFRPNSTLTGCTLRGWWKTEAANLFQVSGGTGAVAVANDPVGYWTDLSGQGNHWTQPTAGSRPTYQLPVEAPRPMLFHDGTDDHLICDALAPYLAGADTAWTLYMVLLNGNVSGNGQVVFAGGRNSTANPYTYCSREGSNISLNRRDDALVTITANGTGGGLSSLAPQVACFRFNGATVDFQIGSNPVVSAAADVGSMTLDRVTLCALRRAGVTQSYYRGYVGEVIFYQGALVTREMKLIRQYLKGRWNLL